MFKDDKQQFSSSLLWGFHVLEIHSGHVCRKSFAVCAQSAEIVIFFWQSPAPPRHACVSLCGGVVLVMAPSQRKPDLLDAQLLRSLHSYTLRCKKSCDTRGMSYPGTVVKDFFHQQRFSVRSTSLEGMLGCGKCVSGHSHCSFTWEASWYCRKTLRELQKLRHVGGILILQTSPEL